MNVSEPGLERKRGSQGEQPCSARQPGQEGWQPWQMSRPQWFPVPVWQLLGGTGCQCVPSFCPPHPEPERFYSIETVCWGVDLWGLKPATVQGHQEPQLDCQDPLPTSQLFPEVCSETNNKRSGPAAGVLQQPRVSPAPPKKVKQPHRVLSQKQVGGRLQEAR